MTDKIYNEDCLQGMKRITDGSVDMILTDLPYGVTRNSWDKKIDLTKFWEQINRVTKWGGGCGFELSTTFHFGVNFI